MEILTAISTVIAILGGLNTLHDSYKKVCGIFSPDPDPQSLQFEQVITQLDKLHYSIERLSDTILYAPNLNSVVDINRSKQQYVNELREVRETLEPVQKAVDSKILSSAMIFTPKKMQTSHVEKSLGLFD